MSIGQIPKSGLANELTPNVPAAGGDRLEEAARQFESLMLQTMLKSMRATVPQGGLFDSNGMSTWYELQDAELAKSLAAKGTLGIAALIRSDLGGAPRPVPTSSTGPVMTGAASSNDTPPKATTPALSGTQAEFVQKMWPLAERHAAELRQPPEVLIAQAALETGWGEHLPAGSENYFGIKASRGWSGERVTAQTLEFRDGQAGAEAAQFRAYPDAAASIADYARLISGASRYEDALQASSPREYLQALQAGGYATDPHYADKVNAVLESPEFAATVARLKQSSARPITAAEHLQARAAGQQGNGNG